jgi:hypothetical protein
MHNFEVDVVTYSHMTQLVFLYSYAQNTIIPTNTALKQTPIYVLEDLI